MEMARQLNGYFAFTESPGANDSFIDAWRAFIGNNASEFQGMVPNLPDQDVERLHTILSLLQYIRSSSRGPLPVPRVPPPTQIKKKNFPTKLTKMIVLAVVSKGVNELFTGASDPSLEWLMPYTNAVLGLGVLSVVAGITLNEKEAGRISKVMMIMGAAATTASFFAPVAALLPPPLAMALTVVATCIFAVTAVLFC